MRKMTVPHRVELTYDIVKDTILDLLTHGSPLGTINESYFVLFVTGADEVMFLKNTLYGKMYDRVFFGNRGERLRELHYVLTE